MSNWDGVVDSSGVTATAFIAGVFQAAGRQPDPNKLEAVSRRIMEDADHLTALDLVAMFDTHNRLSRSVGAFFESHDLLVTPTLGQLPAPHGMLDYNDPRHSVRSWTSSMFEYGPFTALFNITGQPAISLPVGMSTSGLPIGVQLVAPFGREDVLFRVAGHLERAMPWKHRRPAHFVGHALAGGLPAVAHGGGGEWPGDCSLSASASASAVQAACSALGSGRGRLIVIDGPAGVGKTLLMSAAAEAAAAAGAEVARTRGGELEQDLGVGHRDRPGRHAARPSLLGGA